MVGVGMTLLVLAAVAAFWKRREPVLLPGTKTTRVKPIVVVCLVALGIVCFVAAASGPRDADENRKHTEELKLERPRERR